MEIISTHRGSHNFFNQLIREIKENGNPKKISHHRITLQDALEQGFLYKLQQALSSDDEIQSMDEAAYFDFIRSGCADEESFQQEYLCNPADDDSAFLEYDLIASCEYGAAERWEYLLEDLKTASGALYMGIDIGRKSDLTVIWIHAHDYRIAKHA
jgi:phage FluMu gp28-like protein